MAKKYPNGIPAKDGFQILLEGAASADKWPVLRSLVQSRKICNGDSEKNANTLIRYFMEDNLFPHMESVLGVHLIRSIDSAESEEAEVARICESYLTEIGEKMSAEELANFANLVLIYVD